MIDVLRYLMMLTGLCVWLTLVAFLVLGSLAYARQMREQRAAEDAAYDAQRTEGMGVIGHDCWDHCNGDPEAPVYSDLAGERPEVVESLDEARLRRSR